MLCTSKFFSWKAKYLDWVEYTFKVRFSDPKIPILLSTLTLCFFRKQQNLREKVKKNELHWIEAPFGRRANKLKEKIGICRPCLMRS